MHYVLISIDPLLHYDEKCVVRTSRPKCFYDPQAINFDLVSKSHFFVRMNIQFFSALLKNIVLLRYCLNNVHIFLMLNVRKGQSLGQQAK